MDIFLTKIAKEASSARRWRKLQIKRSMLLLQGRSVNPAFVERVQFAAYIPGKSYTIPEWKVEITCRLYGYIFDFYLHANVLGDARLNSSKVGDTISSPCQWCMTASVRSLPMKQRDERDTSACKQTSAWQFHVGINFTQSMVVRPPFRMEKSNRNRCCCYQA